MEQEIINAIGSVGFPIVACVHMAWMHHQTEEQRIADEQRHSDERKSMTEALTKMNVTLDYILSFIKKDKENEE
jgi:hypothetical protein